MKGGTDAFNVYAKKIRVNERERGRTNEVNGIFSRLYIHIYLSTSVREIDIIRDIKSGLPFRSFFFDCDLVVYA